MKQHRVSRIGKQRARKAVRKFEELASEKPVEFWGAVAALASMASAVVAIAAVAVSALQWGIMRDQLADAKAAAAQSAEVAQAANARQDRIIAANEALVKGIDRSAESGAKQADASVAQSIALMEANRPRVRLEIYTTHAFAAGQFLADQVLATNNKLTPADIIGAYVDVQILEPGDNRTIPPLLACKKCVRTQLSQGATFAFTGTLTRPLTTELATSLNEGKSKLVVRARADYLISPHNIKTTVICAYYVPSVKGWSACANSPSYQT